MSGLSWRLAFSAGWGRAALLAGCTAVVSGLLLVAVAVLSLPDQPGEQLFAVVADTGTRYGFVFGVVLLTLPPLLLLHQAVRLGTAARERRLAALRLAGATPGEVRRVGAVEVGVPALVGAVGGLGVYWLLRLVLGGDVSYSVPEGPPGHRAEVRYSLALVPADAPAWWQVLAVVVGVALLGIAVGWFASRHVVVTPLGVVRRATRRPPRPWGALVLLLGAVAVPASVHLPARLKAGVVEDLVIFGSLALLVAGVLMLAPWAAYRVGRLVAGRATSAPVLLAARRLATEPRAAGRAASAVGAIGLVAGCLAPFLADVVDQTSHAYYLIASGLVAAVLPVALVAVVGSLAVHSVESLLERKRSASALVALGAPRELLVRALRWEAGLVAVPMALGGVLLGGLGYGALLGDRGTTLFLLLALALVAALVLLAVWLMSWLVRPWVLKAVDLAHLRTG